MANGIQFDFDPFGNRVATHIGQFVEKNAKKFERFKLEMLHTSEGEEGDVGVRKALLERYARRHKGFCSEMGFY